MAQLDQKTAGDLLKANGITTRIALEPTPFVFDAYGEAKQILSHGSSLSSAEQAAYGKIADYYDHQLTQNSQRRPGDLTHTVNNYLKSLDDKGQKAVLGRFLYHLAHSDDEEKTKGDIATVLGNFPQTDDIKFKGTPMEGKQPEKAFINFLAGGMLAPATNPPTDPKITSVHPWSEKSLEEIDYSAQQNREVLVRGSDQGHGQRR